MNESGNRSHVSIVVYPFCVISDAQLKYVWMDINWVFRIHSKDKSIHKTLNRPSAKQYRMPNIKELMMKLEIFKTIIRVCCGADVCLDECNDDRARLGGRVESIKANVLIWQWCGCSAVLRSILILIIMEM